MNVTIRGNMHWQAVAFAMLVVTGCSSAVTGTVVSGGGSGPSGSGGTAVAASSSGSGAGGSAAGGGIGTSVAGSPNGGTVAGGSPSGAAGALPGMNAGAPGLGSDGGTSASSVGSAGETSSGGTSGGDGFGGAAGRAAGGAAASGSAGASSPGGASGTGGAGGTGNGGSGGGGYQACPSSPCNIMPFGDSITFGVGDEGNAGYRGPLFASAVAEGKQITFTGSVSGGPTTVSGQTFPKRNEGHSGWGITQITPYSGNDAGIVTVIPNPGFSSGSGGVPDIILLHIGTNDSGNLSAAQMTSDLSDLLDTVIMNAPDAYVVVAQIIPLGYGSNDVIKAYNQSIPGLVEERAAAGRHITMVDMFTGFNAGSMLATDNVHPNNAGYKFMADHWYSVIGPLLPQ